MDKFTIQANQYKFPYHYIPSFDRGIPKIHRVLSWGLDYLTYMSFVKELIYEIDPKTILDVGCGDGYLLNTLDLKCQKVGVDLESKSIAFARCFATDATFINGSITEIKDKFELVSLIEVLEHISDEDLPGFLADVYEKIEIDGHLLITVPTTVVPLNKKHYRHYDEEILKKQLSSLGLKEIKNVRLFNKSSYLRKVIETIMCNKWFILNNNKMLKYLWRIHRNNFYFANRNNGLHICTLLKKS